jgi:hypothetical protein
MYIIIKVTANEKFFLYSQGDSTKTSVCLHAPARRMAQITVAIIYSSLIEKRIEKGTLIQSFIVVVKFK